MKTHFTQADVGKTFATNQDGVTATLEIFEGKLYKRLFLIVGENLNGYHSADEHGNIGDYLKVYPDKEIIIPSEADLLRKEMEELKAKHEADLRTAVEMAREGYSSLYLPDEIIDKILNNHGDT